MNVQGAVSECCGSGVDVLIVGETSQAGKTLSSTYKCGHMFNYMESDMLVLVLLYHAERSESVLLLLKVPSVVSEKQEIRCGLPSDWACLDYSPGSRPYAE